MTRASWSIAVALLLISSGASATECQSSPGNDGKWWSWRIVDSKRCWYQGSPGRSKDLLHWAKQSPPPVETSPPVVTRPEPSDSPPPAPPVPPQQSTKIVDTAPTTPKVVSTVPIPVTSKPPQMAAPPPSLPEPPPLPAKPTPPEPLKPSNWWMLLLIIPVIATGLAVVASQYRRERGQGTLFKNFRRRWTNWQARLEGYLDLTGDSIAQWSRRASAPVPIDPPSPNSERPSPQRRNRPSSSLTTFDPKSLIVN
jgi:hypothetical protein